MEKNLMFVIEVYFPCSHSRKKYFCLIRPTELVKYRFLPLKHLRVSLQNKDF